MNLKVVAFFSQTFWMHFVAQILVCGHFLHRRKSQAFYEHNDTFEEKRFFP
jgi:hypothetical protein